MDSVLSATLVQTPSLLAMRTDILAVGTWHESIALVLLHFLWQGCVVAALAELAVRAFRIKHGTPRYMVYLTAFLVLAACPVITFAYFRSTAQETVSAVELSQPISQQVSGWSLELAAVVRPNSEWITALWFVGAFAMNLRFACGLWALKRVQTNLQALPCELVERASQIADRLGIRRPWSVRSSDSAKEPFTFGWLRPMIVVPISLLASEPPEIIDAVLAHEFAHIRRYDLWVNAFQRLVESVLFFHPAIWWISRRVRDERELCCDDIAVRLTSTPIVYATALERVATLRVRWRGASLAVAMGAGVLTYRVRRVLGLVDPITEHTRTSPRLWLASASLLSVFALFGSGGNEWLNRRLVSTTDYIDPLAGTALANEVSKYEQSPLPETAMPLATFELDDEHSKHEHRSPAEPDERAAKTERHIANHSPWMFDINHDGVLDEAERQTIETAYARKMKERSQQMLAKYDTNGDGVLDASEKSAAWKQYRQSPHRHSGPHLAGSHHRSPKHFMPPPPSMASQAIPLRGGDHRLHVHDRQPIGVPRPFAKTPSDNDRPSCNRPRRDRPSAEEQRELWRKQIIAKYDDNGNGVLDEAERAAMHVAWKEHRMKQWKAFIERYDVDGDGHIDEHERMAIQLAHVRVSRTDRKYPGST